MHPHHISQEGFERLHTWIYATYPRALEMPEFLPGLIYVVELEVDKALKEHCWRTLRRLSEPCRQ